MTFDAQEAVRQSTRAQGPPGEIHGVRHATCCIAGCGPAGAMLGLLLARKGVDVLVLEKHGDFLRDFRGDTLHPSTLQLIDELGLIDEFLSLPHRKVSELNAVLD